MFPVTITLHNPTQMNAVMAALGSDFQPASTKPEADKPAATKNAKDTKTKADPKPDAAPSSEPTQTVSDNAESSSTESNEASATEQLSYQEVAALITKVSRTVSREAAVELLDGFGAKRGPDLKPEQFADVVAACEKALAREAE